MCVGKLFLQDSNVRRCSFGRAASFIRPFCTADRVVTCAVAECMKYRGTFARQLLRGYPGSSPSGALR